MNHNINNCPVLFGKNARDILEHEITKYKKVLILIDENIKDISYIKDEITRLEDADVNFIVIDNIKENPTISNIKSVYKTIKKEHNDCILYYGKDETTAKVVSLLAKNTHMKNIGEIVDKQAQIIENLPLYIVSTSLGLTSCLNYISINDIENNQRLYLKNENIKPTLVIYDYEIIKNISSRELSIYGLDIISRSLEVLLSKNIWKVSEIYATEAIKLVNNNLESAIGKNEEAINNLIYAAYLSSEATNTSSLSLIKAMSDELCLRYNANESMSRIIITPKVLEYLIDDTNVERIAQLFNIEKNTKAKQNIIKYLKDLNIRLSIPKTLKELFAKDSDFPSMAKSVVNNLLIISSSINIEIEEVKKLYDSLY